MVATASPRAGLDVLTPRDTASTILGIGSNGVAKASAHGLPCRFLVEADDNGYDRSTFYEEGLAFLESSLSDVRSMESGTSVGPMRFVVTTYEAVAAAVDAVPVPSTTTSPRVDITLAISADPVDFLMAGAPTWATVWAHATALAPLFNVSAVSLDVTPVFGNVATPDPDATDALRAFLADAGQHNVGVELVLADPNWVLQAYHSNVRVVGGGAAQAPAPRDVAKQREQADCAVARARLGLGWRDADMRARTCVDDGPETGSRRGERRVDLDGVFRDCGPYAGAVIGAHRAGNRESVGDGSRDQSSVGDGVGDSDTDRDGDGDTDIGERGIHCECGVVQRPARARRRGDHPRLGGSGGAGIDRGLRESQAATVLYTRTRRRDGPASSRTAPRPAPLRSVLAPRAVASHRAPSARACTPRGGALPSRMHA